MWDIIRYITGRKQTGKEQVEASVARTAEKKAEEIIKVMMDSVIITDSEGKIIQFNKAFTDFLGWGKEAIGKHPTKFVVENDVPEVMEAIRESFEKGYVKNFECTVITKDKKEVPVLVNSALMKDTKGNPTGIIAVLRDITERKQVEEELKTHHEYLEELVEKRTAELARVNQQLQREINERKGMQERLVRQKELAVLGQLVSGVGHELRNPLGVIKNTVYFLNMILEKPEQKIKEALDILEKEVITSDRIISTLLAFAHPKLPTRQKADINQILQEVLSRVIVPENIEVMAQFESLPPIPVDPGQLSQAFRNIILNGIQAMSEGGELVVKSKLESPEQVVVSFTDTGVGIPEENLRRLFEPLFTTKVKGFGLGLAIAKTLVEGHGGVIEVESEVGKGSTFTVKLLTAEGRKSRMEEKARILIADDDISLRKIVSFVLEHKGYDIATTRDGPGVIEKVKEEPFDVIFMDIKMPLMNDIETYKRIKEIRPETVVMMMTAYTVEDLVQKTLEEEAYVIYTPLDVKKAASVIKEATEINKGMFVLVIDEDPESCIPLINMLAKENYKVGIAHTGEETIAMVQSKRYNIIFIDTKLPTINGLELYLATREIDSKVVVIMVTSCCQDMTDLVEEALNNHAYTCLYKPLDMNKVLRLINEIQEKKQEARR